MTPLEAATKAAHDRMVADHVAGRLIDPEAVAVAALSAAIEALPELLDTGTVWDNQMKTENRYEDHEGESVYISRLKIVRGPWLRRAFGVGDQG